MNFGKTAVASLLLLAFNAAAEPAAPLTPEAVRSINDSIDAKALMASLADVEYGSAESYRILGRHMKQAFLEAGYDADKTFRDLVAALNTAAGRRFARESGFYRVLDSIDSGDAAQIDAWIASGVVSRQSIGLHRGTPASKR